MAPSEEDYHVAIIGSGGTGATVATDASVRCCVIIIIDDQHSTTDLVVTGRGYGKTYASSQLIIPVREAVYDPPFYHDYPMLIHWHRGAIVRQLKSKDRPAVVRRHNNTNDRRINKRKTYLRSL